MARVSSNWWKWNHTKTVLLLWLISATVFYTLFKMALRNADHSSSSDSSVSYAEQRSKLYDNMARDLDEHGALFLKGGETSQSLSISDIFTIKDGSVAPVLKAANPPVRANVLYLGTEYSQPISEAVRQIFNPYFDKAIWFQNSSLYHFSMFHASHHIVPVPATENEKEVEANAVSMVAKELCPLRIVLDRVVLTSTGVLLGCWQVISGPDPVTIRSKLRTALPHAPEKQLYDAAILHTSFARLLGRPKASTMELRKSDEIQFFHELVARLNNQLHGFKHLFFAGPYAIPSERS
ncbi:uncharacterized protein LOC107419287 isoform X2 [Ziziphus jujuba]|uniref:Uncharacterized protein LOC107419287 isoform X2 n=1 Tax=Ziziphus jujuba TaxID=326968 RepID=A0A6P3ZUP6_ZIZJJ|nr:uncharacterized protein LOC107419287 isoform X2 [Ziziphus jujuba]